MNVFYLISCKTCRKQYTGSSEEFIARFYNKGVRIITIIKKKKFKEEPFHANIAATVHSGEEDWEVTLIDQSDSTQVLRKKESLWEYELDTFQPNGLNERDVALF